MASHTEASRKDARMTVRLLSRSCTEDEEQFLTKRGGWISLEIKKKKILPVLLVHGIIFEFHLVHVILFHQAGCLKGFRAEQIILTLSINQGLWTDGCLALSYDNVWLADIVENTRVLSQCSSGWGEGEESWDGREEGVGGINVGFFFKRNCETEQKPLWAMARNATFQNSTMAKYQNSQQQSWLATLSPWLCSVLLLESQGTLAASVLLLEAPWCDWEKDLLFASRDVSCNTQDLRGILVFREACTAVWNYRSPLGVPGVPGPVQSHST